MSRKARLPIALPKGVEAKFGGKALTVKGPKGTLSGEIREEILVEISEGKITVRLHEGKEEASNILGLYWSLIANMVKGVSEGFEKRLEMVGVGFRAAVQGKLLDLQIGLSHPTKVKIPDGIEVAVEKNTNIQIKGIDKRLVGQFAADIRGKKPPEPYKGKGIRYVDEYVNAKQAKPVRRLRGFFYMDNSQLHRNRTRIKRVLRVRQNLRGDQDKPRLSVHKSSKHLYVQLIDDEKSTTLASISTMTKEFRDSEYNRKNKEAAKQLGLKIAELAKQKNVQKVVFDRGRYKYHGLIASIADGAREGGLQL